MSSGIIHRTMGMIVVASAIFIIQYFNWYPLTLTTLDWIVLLVIGWVYGQIADIDQENSKINDTISLGLIGFAIYSFLYTLPLAGILCLSTLAFMQLVKHRTVVHTVIFGILLASPLWFINPLYSIMALLAFISHLVLDKHFTLWG